MYAFNYRIGESVFMLCLIFTIYHENLIVQICLTTYGILHTESSTRQAATLWNVAHHMQLRIWCAYVHCIVPERMFMLQRRRRTELATCGACVRAASLNYRITHRWLPARALAPRIDFMPTADNYMAEALMFRFSLFFLFFFS